MNDMVERLTGEAYWSGDSTGRDPGTELDTLRRAVADSLNRDPDTWPEHGNAPLAIAAALASRLVEVERLTKWVDDLQSGMWVNCVYCGHRYGPGETTPTSMADALKEHVEQCPRHPMSALKAEVERAVEERRTASRRSVELFAENARLREALEDLRDALLVTSTLLEGAMSQHDSISKNQIAANRDLAARALLTDTEETT